jgi:hypothetical protein
MNDLQRRMTRKDYFRFRATWATLSETGACDCIGGAEYERVCGEWERAGCPEGIEAFIRERANVGPFELAR